MIMQFEHTKRWQDLRKAVLARDKYMDQMELRSGKKVNAQTVHHIFPADQYPEYKWCAWNLISLTRENHELMHNRMTGELTAAGKKLQQELAEQRGIKTSRLVLVIGYAGAGKTTYVRQHLGSGLAYDLDYIAAAFRLRKPKEEVHDPARRMANSMVKAFAVNARRYTGTVYMIRTVPRLDELEAFEPDTIVHIKGGKPFGDQAERMTELIDFIKANEISLVEI